MRLVKAKAARKNKKKLAAFRKNDHGKGFTRTKKQWENSFADHVGKFIDRLTFTDVLNAAVFGASAITVYKSFDVIEAIGHSPTWWATAFPPSMFPMNIIVGVIAGLTATAVQEMDETDKILLSIIGGYSAVTLAPVVVRAAVSAVPSALTGA